jgi:3-hydroxyacyl-[acyl-carrier-protein] dehydratase
MCKQIESLAKSLQVCCKKYQINTKDKVSLSISSVFVFPDSFPGFDGHFPGQPVLPAIIQLAAVRYLAECGLGLRVRLGGYSRTKFRGIIQPYDEIEVTLDLLTNEKQWSGKFVLKRAGKELVSNGSCIFVSSK